MKRTWTIIGVRDVPGSFKWYRSLFGQPPSNTLTKPDRRDDVDRVPCCEPRDRQQVHVHDRSVEPLTVP